MKKSNSIISKIKDWKEQLMELFLPLFVALVAFFADLPKLLKSILFDSNVEICQLEWYWQVVIEQGNYIIALLLFAITYIKIRKFNKNKVLKQNEDLVVWHSYIGYWVCRYILNYQTISLIRIPIPIQFELVWKGLFEKYEYMENITTLEKGSDQIHRNFFGANPTASIVNLVLTDTYPLEWKAKLPASVLNYTTIVIERIGEKGVRYYSPDFIAMIASTVHELPDNVAEINIFATINSAHVYHIANEIFKTGGRDGKRIIRIYQQTSGSWTFEGKYVEIKTGV